MKNVLLFLANGFEVYEAAAFFDVIGWNFLEGDKSTKIVTCGLRKSVTSSFNLTVIPDKLIDEVDADNFEALAIPGGFEEFGYYNDAYDERVINLIKKFNNDNKIIATICVGALPLGKSGILKNKTATTYNLNNQLRQKQLKEFGAEVINQPIVINENIITSFNPSTAIDVAFILLEKLTSPENAKLVRQLMGFSDKN